MNSFVISNRDVIFGVEKKIICSNIILKTYVSLWIVCVCMFSYSNQLYKCTAYKCDRVSAHKPSDHSHTHAHLRYTWEFFCSGNSTTQIMFGIWHRTSSKQKTEAVVFICKYYTDTRVYVNGVKVYACCIRQSIWIHIHTVYIHSNQMYGTRHFSIGISLQPEVKFNVNSEHRWTDIFSLNEFQ